MICFGRAKPLSEATVPPKASEWVIDKAGPILREAAVPARFLRPSGELPFFPPKCDWYERVVDAKILPTLSRERLQSAGIAFKASGVVMAFLSVPSNLLVLSAIISLVLLFL